MNHRCSFLITTLFFSILSTAQAEVPINNSSTANAIINNNNNVFLSISTKNITKHCADWISNNIRTTNDTVKKQIQDFLWEKQYTIVATTFICSYAAASYLLLADYYYITQKDRWAQWKSDCSFAQLCALSQQDLSKELLFTIGECTFNRQNPTNNLPPLISFINDLNDEIVTIERYIKTAKTIKRWGLMSIFPTNDNKIEHAEKLFERAHFIKHIFLSWFAEYNFANARKKSNKITPTLLKKNYLKREQ